MNQLTYTKHERISLRDDPTFNERWLQDRIAEDPTLLGLGDVILKDRERPQPRAGRLDLLLQEADANRRYEVEIQLGKTDEAHIIRSIEYWDIERKRYPQYDHVAVLVAEDITSRFLNVIGLFNGVIPLIAIQLSALRIGNQVTLAFSTVLDETRLGLVEEDEEVQATTDRAYWETRASKSSLTLLDDVFSLLQEIDPKLELKYNKFYVGLAKDGHSNLFVLFRPKKDSLRMELRLERSDELSARLEEAGLDVMDYDTRYGRYRIRLSRPDLAKHRAMLSELLRTAHSEAE